jgi:hypothetical protein
MEVRIQAIHFDATEKLQDFIQKKTAKLEKYCDDINKVEVSFLRFSGGVSNCKKSWNDFNCTSKKSGYFIGFLMEAKLTL